jgi:putative metallopeptidase DUF4344
VKLLALVLSLLMSLNCERSEALTITPDQMWMISFTQIRDAYPDLNVRITLETCGEVNAYTEEDKDNPGGYHVAICRETLQRQPRLARFYFAHELAHATVHQYEIPFTGSEEDAADELAALIMVENGWAIDVMYAARYFLDQEDDVPAWDPHPPNDKRAFTLRCLALKLDSGLCPRYYTPAHDAWVKLLQDAL